MGTIAPNVGTVYPVMENILEVNTGSKETPTWTPVHEMETMDVSIDNGNQTWNPIMGSGWQRAMNTTKAMTISCSGKRSFGDEGNDYIAALFDKIGNAVLQEFRVTYPNGDYTRMRGIVNVTGLGGGSSADVQALNFDILSDGVPDYVVATP